MADNTKMTRALRNWAITFAGTVGFLSAAVALTPLKIEFRLSVTLIGTSALVSSVVAWKTSRPAQILADGLLEGNAKYTLECPCDSSLTAQAMALGQDVYRREAIP